MKKFIQTKALRNKRAGFNKSSKNKHDVKLFLYLLEPKKVVTGPAILKTLPVIKSKDDRPLDQIEVLPTNVLSSDYVEEIEMTYDEPTEPKPKNVKLKNLRANGKHDERPCPKV